MTEAEQKAANGVFEDKDVRDRTLSGWDGPGSPFIRSCLMVRWIRFSKKRRRRKIRCRGEGLLPQGYATDVDAIGIENNVMEFHRGKTVSSCRYDYSGYKILTYASGKKGVRYLFECKDNASQAPKFVQFSDHIIGPKALFHTSISLWATPPTRRC